MPLAALPTRAPKHPGTDMKFVFERVFGEGPCRTSCSRTALGLLDTVLSSYNCSGKKHRGSVQELLPHPLP